MINYDSNCQICVVNHTLVTIDGTGEFVIT